MARLLIAAASMAFIAACGQRSDAPPDSSSGRPAVAVGPSVYEAAVAAMDRFILRFVKPR